MSATQGRTQVVQLRCEAQNGGRATFVFQGLGHSFQDAPGFPTGKIVGAHRCLDSQVMVLRL